MSPTVRTLSESLLQQMSERIEARTGLHFPKTRFADLARGLEQASGESGSRDACAYAESLLTRDLHAADVEILAGSLTIGETHFFRDPRAFALLETTLLPELIASKRNGDRRLRLWSAGCASGEEPYSLAILLHRLIPDLADWNITILATDLNPKALARAAAGIYTEWSFRDTADWVKPEYFTLCSGNRYAINPRLKHMVTFACLNLADDNYPSVLNNTNALDLIICRNVLLYFSPTRIPEVVRRFYRALVDGGQLVLGAVEASQVVTPELTFVAAPGVALYRKDGRTGEAKLETGTSKLEAQKLGILIAEGARTPGAAFKVSRHNVPVSRPKPTSTAKRSSSGPPAETPPSLYAAGRYREACQMLLAEADRAKGRDPQSAVLLAQCYASLGELAEALVWCERALAIARTDPALHFLHAGILQELSRDDESQRALRNVLYLDPGHVAAHYAMANLHRRGNRLPAATRHLANVRQLLAGRDESEELPQSGGLTVGRLNAIMNATLGLTGTKNGKTHE